jgi:molybdopterin molybdotransferase
MPEGLDTVVPQEHTTPAAEPGHITLAADAVRLGSNRRRRGEDLAQGSTALARGDVLGPAALGLVASLGLARLAVYRRLRVAYFSTGDEILGLGDPPREGAVYDSNRYTVYGLLTRLGVQVIDLGAVRDDPAAIEAALRSAARQADAVITSGGMSAGDADHTRTTLRALGDMAFWRIAMRPGRPMAVGRIAPPQGGNGAGTVFFGLPGNPVAVMVAFLAFVRPALLRMMGSTQALPPLLRATTTEALDKKPGRTEYQRGIVSSTTDGVLQVRTTGHQGSGVLSSMAQANGLIVLEQARGPVAAGEAVDVMVFDGVI